MCFKVCSKTCKVKRDITRERERFRKRERAPQVMHRNLKFRSNGRAPYSMQPNKASLQRVRQSCAQVYVTNGHAKHESRKTLTVLQRRCRAKAKIQSQNGSLSCWWPTFAQLSSALPLTD